MYLHLVEFYFNLLGTHNIQWSYELFGSNNLFFLLVVNSEKFQGWQMKGCSGVYINLVKKRCSWSPGFWTSFFAAQSLTRIQNLHIMTQNPLRETPHICHNSEHVSIFWLMDFWYLALPPIFMDVEHWAPHTTSNLSQTFIVWSIYLHEWLLFMINVGKYTNNIPYIQCLGI